MPFAGFPEEALAFYAGLEAEPTKAYWTAHRDVFETAVRGPLEALVEELEERYGPGRIMRPYRDVRFSKDKTPYRMNLGAMLGQGYVQISADGLGIGSGMYHLEPDQLERFRPAVDAERTGAELAAIVDALRAAAIEVWHVDALKTAPRGYDRAHPRIELLRSRGLVAWRSFEPAPWLATPAAIERVVATLDAAAPLRAWLAAHVGPSAQPRGR